MRNRRKRALAFVTAILALTWSVTVYEHKGFAWADLPQSSPTDSLPSLQGDKAVERLKQQGLYASLESAAEAARYEIRWEDRTTLADLPAAYHAPNTSQRLNAYFDATELRIAGAGSPNDAANTSHSEWQATMKLIGYGYNKNLLPLAAGDITATGNRIEINKSAIRNPQSSIVEWYVNKADGLEQGFTVDAPPSTRSDGDRLRLAIELTGDLKAEIAEEGQAIVLKRENPDVVLRYGDLLATDATGRTLPSRMRLGEGCILLEVDDTDAISSHDRSKHHPAAEARCKRWGAE
jgi:hypothetical protein